MKDDKTLIDEANKEFIKLVEDNLPVEGKLTTEYNNRIWEKTPDWIRNTVTITETTLPSARKRVFAQKVHAIVTARGHKATPFLSADDKGNLSRSRREYLDRRAAIQANDLVKLGQTFSEQTLHYYDVEDRLEAEQREAARKVVQLHYPTLTGEAKVNKVEEIYLEILMSA